MNFEHDSSKLLGTRLCDHPGCSREAVHRAPKDKRNPRSFYWFCLEHVRAFNAGWDFFAGLSAHQIEEYIRHATVWERPTWPFGKTPFRTNQTTPKRNQGATAQVTPPHIVAALGQLGLTPPISWASIKARHRALVKQHHPDTGGNKANPDQFHIIQRAFTILREHYRPSGKT